MDKVKAAIVGLGRLGRHYARNLCFKIPNVDLVAACSLNDQELTHAKYELGIENVYASFDKMLKQKDLQALFILSSTQLHAKHITAGLRAGLHVFSEKPLALDVKSCLKVKAISDKHPKQLAVVGFVRRFDPSYVYAREKVDAGEIGRPFLVKSQTADVAATARFQIEFLKTGGGVFHDMNIHDVDLARWFLDSNVKSVFATGGAFRHAEFEQAGDADNTLAICEFENGSMATIGASRTAAHGHDTYTEIVGTEGMLRVGRPANFNRVEISDKHGVRIECIQTFYDRFHEGFLLQIQDFVDCIQQGRKPKLTLDDAIQATRATEALTKSFKQNKLIRLA